MVIIYYIKVNELSKLYNEPIQLLKFIPEKFHKEAFKYVHKHDQFVYIIGRLLIIKLFECFGYEAKHVENLQKSKYDKPFLNNTLGFNLSHSGDIVLCTGAMNCEIGIDIEQMKEIDITDFENTFSVEEWNTISSANPSLNTFYNMWTQKESIAKADGRGLNVDLKTIKIKNTLASISDSRTLWHLKKLYIAPGYSCHLCCDKPIETVKIRKFDINKITAYEN